MNVFELDLACALSGQPLPSLVRERAQAMERVDRAARRLAA